jgi:hypothetical protein
MSLLLTPEGCTWQDMPALSIQNKHWVTLDAMAKAGLPAHWPAALEGSFATE